ncbi:putative nuclease HARBI1 [Daphnia magna]|uniref:putative nuclease HARBI1 n=1 Tax=Daphnia magna TaxID=35525 RepID=UPI001E1BBA9F|nr:putative nuclease HARBI1 [Daphnia magna]
MDRDVNEIDEFMEDLANLTDVSDYLSSSDSEGRKEERRIKKSRLIPFYKTRKDILTYFCEEKLMRTFRFDRVSIEYITALLEHLFPKRKTKAKRNLRPLDMVLIALQFYATGTFQTVVGNVLRYSQSSVSRSISWVSLALSLISHKHICFPANLNNLKIQFAEIARIPGIIGCIDGTHIRLQRPTVHEKAYVNRKNYHSISVQGICDANHKFLSVCATKPGSCHDSSIFKCSTIGKKFKAGDFGTSIMLGDSGYANTPFLIIPYNEPTEAYKTRFNAAHKTTRCVIDRAFGILKKRFNVLHSEIRMPPVKRLGLL